MAPYEMEVYTARSGQEALRQMTQVWPDLVLMDHMMPEMDGVETTQRIRDMGRKDPYFAVVPIIALTANAMKGVREEFLQSGFNDYISKPVELDKLDDVLRPGFQRTSRRPPPSPWAPWWPSPSPRTCGTCRTSTWPGACPTAAPARSIGKPSSSSGSRSPAASGASARPGMRAVGRTTSSRSTA